MGDAVEITDVTWKGMRCNVAVDGDFKGSRVDIRLQAGSASSSVVMNVKAIKDSGIGSVVIENDELEGKDAFLERAIRIAFESRRRWFDNYR